jgi:hypothetical protein
VITQRCQYLGFKNAKTVESVVDVLVFGLLADVIQIIGIVKA